MCTALHFHCAQASSYLKKIFFDIESEILQILRDFVNHCQIWWMICGVLTEFFLPTPPFILYLLMAVLIAYFMLSCTQISFGNYTTVWSDILTENTPSAIVYNILSCSYAIETIVFFFLERPCTYFKVMHTFGTGVCEALHIQKRMHARVCACAHK
jgi:hypothetical protein